MSDRHTYTQTHTHTLIFFLNNTFSSQSVCHNSIISISHFFCNVLTEYTRELYVMLFLSGTIRINSVQSILIAVDIVCTFAILSSCSILVEIQSRLLFLRHCCRANQVRFYYKMINIHLAFFERLFCYFIDIPYNRIIKSYLQSVQSGVFFPPIQL